MTKCAVVIGVDKTKGLPVLDAAASGADKFADWAKGQGFQVALLTDSNGASVSLGDVKKKIRDFVKEKTFSQLIVFFSGHGILRSPDCELWLLSDALDDPNEAVNVSGSIWQARNAGIPHVAMISDACRSRPETSKLSQIQGGVIFPNNDPKLPRPAVDVFYATLPGNPALEAATQDAANNYRGIFTEALLKGLEGQVNEVIVPMDHQDPNKTRWVVPSWKLKPYLEKEVPQVASSISIKLQQNPDIRVESHPPKFLAEVMPPATTRAMRDIGERRSLDGAIVYYGSAAERVCYGNEDVDYESGGPDFRKIAEGPDGKREIANLLKVKGRESFETGTGFTVVGVDVARATVTNSDCDLFEDFGAQQIRVRESRDAKHAQSTLIQFGNGSGVLLAVLPGLIGTLVMEEGRVVTVSYTPSRHTSKYEEYEAVADEVEARRALAAVAARNGMFHLKEDCDFGGPEDWLRSGKGVDPTLGLYACYAYARTGSLDQVESVYEHMHSQPDPVPFDVALLANKLPRQERLLQSGRLIAPFCPMLTQGWAILEPYYDVLPSVVQKVGGQLLPGLWTTFLPDGVELLWAAITKGELV